MAQRYFFTSDPVTSIPTGVRLGRHLGVYSLFEYADLTHLAVDAQPALDAAVADAGATGGIILFPPATYTIKSIKMADGLHYVGAGPNITRVQQPDGVNASLITVASNKTALSFLNHCSVRNMRLVKKAPYTDTLGSAIEINCRVGELCHFRDLLITDWPESGLKLNHTGQPVVIRDVHAFGCKEYGLDLRRSAGDVTHMMILDGMSGDNHGKGLIRLKGGGSYLETVRIVNVKAECIVAGTMPCVLEIDGVNNMTVQLENLALYAIQPVPTIIKVTTSTVRIDGGIVRAGGNSGASVEGQTLLIDDLPAVRQVPYTGARMRWVYSSADGLREL